MTKIRCQTTPQQRSNLARKAAQARWSHVNGRGDANGSPNPNGSSITNGSPSLPANREPRTAKRSKPIAHSSWLDSRFCLRLEQDPAGVWWLLTPAGLRLPASPAEISLWLDLQSLLIKLSNL